MGKRERGTHRVAEILFLGHWIQIVWSLQLIDLTTKTYDLCHARHPFPILYDVPLLVRRRSRDAEIVMSLTAGHTAIPSVLFRAHSHLHDHYPVDDTKDQQEWGNKMIRRSVSGCTQAAVISFHCVLGSDSRWQESFSDTNQVLITTGHFLLHVLRVKRVRILDANNK